MRPCAHVKPLRNPFQRQGRTSAQLAGNLDLLRVSFAAVAPIHEVVDGAGILDSEFARHRANNDNNRGCINS